MIRGRFQQNIVSGRLTLPVTIVFSGLVWIAAWGAKPDRTSPVLYSFWRSLLGSLPADFIGEAISFLIYGLSAYLLIELNNAYSLIRAKTTFQCTVFILLLSACPFLFSLQIGSIAGLCLLASIYFLFRTYQKQQPVGYMFHAFLFAGIGTLFFPGLFFYVPLFFIGAFQFKSLTFRTFFAGVLGISLPYWFLLGHAYFYGQLNLFYEPFLQLVSVVPIDYSQLEIYQLLPAVLAILLYIVALFHFWMTDYQDKIRARSFLNFLILITCWTILFSLLQPHQLPCLYPILLVGSSLLAGHLFVLTSNKVSNFFFIAFLVFVFGLTFYNLWMILYN